MLDRPSLPDVEIVSLEPSLADVIVTVQRDSSLPKPKRDAWSCSIRRMAEFLGERPRPVAGQAWRPALWSCLAPLR
jgi:hypothetical protein